jgi:hypothetical protein
MRLKLTDSAVLLLACASLAGGCAEKPLGDVWVVGEMVALTDRTPRIDDPAIYVADRARLSLFGGANETVAFQLVIDGGAIGLEDVRIAWTDLAGPGKASIPAESIQLLRMLPVRVSEFPAWYVRLSAVPPEPVNVYDALAPLERKPLKLAPNERLAVWVDVNVPRDARAGEYVADFRVSGVRTGQYGGALTAGTAPRLSWNVKLAVEVYDFVLPDSRPLAATGGFDHNALFAAFLKSNGQPYTPVNLDRSNPMVLRGLAILRQLMVLAHRHRLDLFDRAIHPVFKRDLAGKVAVDWTDYDAIVLPYLNGTAFGLPEGVAAWPIPFSSDWPNPSSYGGAGSAEYAAVTEDMLNVCRDHFRKLGADRQAFLWLYRGEVCAEAYDRHAALARIARAADPNTPILATLPPRPPAETTWTVPGDFQLLVDIFAPPGQWLDPALASAARKDRPLAGVWFAPGQPPYVPPLAVSATPADARVLPWFAMKYGCTGLLLGEVLNWSGDVFNTEAGAQTRLFYPGAAFGLDEVLPSVRLKRLRRGLQDIAYLHLLRQRERPSIARTMLDTMTRYAALAATGDNYLDVRLNGWVQSPEAWEIARRLLAEEVQAAVHPSEASARRLLVQQLEWKKLEERNLAVRVEQVRSRVAPVAAATSPKAGRLRATIMVDLYNEYTRDVDCLVKLDNLPEQWKAVEGEVRLSPLPPATRKTVTLTAEGDFVPATANAKLPMPIGIVVDESLRQRADFSIPFLVAGAARKPPKIDGQLADWPMRTGNTAGDFKLVGRRNQQGTGLARRQTLVLALADDRNLYLAFRCDEPNLAGMIQRPDNLVRYQQLMACEEDLVEVILDPGGSAGRTEDLYHLVIKPNGVLIAERGIGCDPPLGKVGQWASGATVAVAREAQSWTVELAIPLASFGQAGKSEFWSVNFARFASQGAESSSWSGAPRYFYDPRNLGTMVVVRSAE